MIISNAAIQAQFYLPSSENPQKYNHACTRSLSDGKPRASAIRRSLFRKHLTVEMKIGNRCRAATPFASGCILRRAVYNFIWWKSRPEQTVEARPVKLRTHTAPRDRIRVEAHPVAVCTIPWPYPIENQRFDSVVQRAAICVSLEPRVYLIPGDVRGLCSGSSSKRKRRRLRAVTKVAAKFQRC